MKAASLQESWQRKFDSSFPGGCIATWAHGSTEANVTYRVSYIRVTGTSGLDPVFSLYVYGSEQVKAGLVLASWEVLRAKPHLIVKAVVAGQRSPLILSAKVPDELKAQLQAERKQVLQQFSEVA